MLFSNKLTSEIHTPWKRHYISYDQLKKLLKESIAHETEWFEEDESRFVQLLDKELDKVCKFETEKYDEISDKLSKVESQAHSLDFKQATSKQLDVDLGQILDDASHLDKFRRLNHTGFVKVVRKHDRIHSQYRVMPLLQARFRSVPFYSEDYSPLLRRLGNLYTFMDQQSGSASSSLALTKSYRMNSVDKDYHSSGYKTLQFWVHPDNLMEVKTLILRKLPVLVYNREDDDEDNDKDPIVTSLYLDNRDFKIYKSLLERDSQTGSETEPSNFSPTSLRFRWYGKLYESPEIVLEQHNEFDGRITRIVLKQKAIDKFLAGEKSVLEKQARKLREKKVHHRAVDDFVAAATELQTFIVERKLEPIMRTVYRRMAFEIPGDDRVRVILDQDILFTREDSLNRLRPIRDPSTWHRVELDQPGIDLMKMLRKGEYARFPYSVLEVRLRAGTENGVEKLHWIEELQNSKLIREVPHFTKFLHGVAVLYGDDDDDRLDTLPFWLSDFDGGRDASDATAESMPIASSSQNAQSVHRMKSYKFDSEDDGFDSEDSGLHDQAEEFGYDSDHENDVGYPTRIQGKLADGESEGDEVNLPPGVEQPSEWIKNQSSPNVEAKVWLANERTFNRWLHTTCLLSALTFTLYNSVDSAASTATATTVAYILFGITIFSGVWGYMQYMLRIRYIKERGDRPMDAPFGPIVISIGLLAGLVMNFLAIYKKST